MAEEKKQPRFRVVRLGQTQPADVVAALEQAGQDGYLPSNHLQAPAIPLANGDLLLIFEAGPEPVAEAPVGEPAGARA